MVEQFIEATIAGDKQQLKVMLSQGMAIDAKNPTGYTALQHAIWLGNADLIEFLLIHGASVSDKNHQGNTPLHIATWCSYRDRDAVRASLGSVLTILLRYKACPNALNDFGLTPLHHAVYYQFEEAASLLLAFGASPEQKIACMAEKGLSLLPAHWQQFHNAGFKPGMTALDIARLVNNETLVRLLSSGATA